MFPQPEYTVSQKNPTFKLSVTLSNINRFSKLLHCWKFATKPIQHYPTHLRHVVTLPQEIKNSNFPQIFSTYGRKHFTKISAEFECWVGHRYLGTSWVRTQKCGIGLQRQENQCSCLVFVLLICLKLFSEKTQDEEHQRRLAAFERAGVENYLYWKRCEQENKIDKKADSTLHRQAFSD